MRSIDLAGREVAEVVGRQVRRPARGRCWSATSGARRLEADPPGRCRAAGSCPRARRTSRRSARSAAPERAGTGDRRPPASVADAAARQAQPPGETGRQRPQQRDRRPPATTPRPPAASASDDGQRHRRRDPHRRVGAREGRSCARCASPGRSPLEQPASGHEQATNVRAMALGRDVRLVGQAGETRTALVHELSPQRPGDLAEVSARGDLARPPRQLGSRRHQAGQKQDREHRGGAAKRPPRASTSRRATGPAARSAPSCGAGCRGSSSATAARSDSAPGLA